MSNQASSNMPPHQEPHTMPLQWQPYQPANDLDVAETSDDTESVIYTPSTTAASSSSPRTFADSAREAGCYAPDARTSFYRDFERGARIAGYYSPQAATFVPAEAHWEHVAAVEEAQIREAHEAQEALIRKGLEAEAEMYRMMDEAADELDPEGTRLLTLARVPLARSPTYQDRPRIERTRPHAEQPMPTVQRQLDGLPKYPEHWDLPARRPARVDHTRRVSRFRRYFEEEYVPPRLW